MKKRVIRTLTLSALGILIGAAIAWQQIGADTGREKAQRLEPAAGTATATETPVGGPFSLTDHNGAPVTEKSYPGLKLAFFGFTYCPDMCPTGLKKMTMVMEALGDDAALIQPLFITVDPARDTPEVMKDYLAVYDSRLVGLTGSKEEIDAVKESFRVYAAKVEGYEPQYYSMDHSGFTYLLRDDGTMLTVFAHDEDPKEMVKEIRSFLKQG